MKGIASTFALLAFFRPFVILESSVEEKMQTALIHADMADFLLLFHKIFPLFGRKAMIPGKINLPLLPGGHLEMITQRPENMCLLPAGLFPAQDPSNGGVSYEGCPIWRMRNPDAMAVCRECFWQEPSGCVLSKEPWCRSKEPLLSRWFQVVSVEGADP